MYIYIYIYIAVLQFHQFNSLHLELLGTERVCDILQRVAETVSVVVGGMDAPHAASAGVWVELNPVCHRVHLTVPHCQLHTESSLQGREIRRKWRRMRGRKGW